MIISAMDFFGFDIVEVLLHMLNLALLLLGIRFLLYKPVKKIMEKRKQQYEEAEAARTAMLSEADEWNKSREALMDDARREEAEIRSRAVIKAEAERQLLIDKAKKDAAGIMEKASRDMDLEKQKLKEELSHTVPELAVNIASKILEREISTGDNDKLIQSVLENWKEG